MSEIIHEVRALKRRASNLFYKVSTFTRKGNSKSIDNLLEIFLG